MKHLVINKIAQWAVTIVIFILVGIVIYALVTQEEAESKIFNWLRDMAPIIAAGATLILAWAAFKAINEQREERIERRRVRALERIRDWAEDTIGILTVDEPGIVIRNVEDASRRLQKSRVSSLTIVNEAGYLGGELEHEVLKAVHALNVFSVRLLGDKSTEEERGVIKPVDNVKQVRTREELQSAIKDFVTILVGVIKRVTPRLLDKQ